MHLRGRAGTGAVRLGYQSPPAPRKPLPIPMPSLPAEPGFHETLSASHRVGLPRTPQSVPSSGVSSEKGWGVPCNLIYPTHHIPARSRTLDFRAPFLPPVFLATGFFWDGDLAFLAGGGVMMASNFPLDPRFFASNSGWIFGNTPPLAMVTPFSSLQENQSCRW